VAAYPVDGGPTASVCLGICPSTWDRAGKSLYFRFPNGGDKNTYALPLQRSGLPQLPADGISGTDELSKWKVPVVAPGVFESVGTLSQYAFTRRTIRPNLYRTPLP